MPEVYATSRGKTLEISKVAQYLQASYGETRADKTVLKIEQLDSTIHTYSLNRLMALARNSRQSLVTPNAACYAHIGLRSLR